MGVRVAMLTVALVVLAVATVACEQDIEGQNEAAQGDSDELEEQAGTIDIFDLRTGHCFADPGLSFTQDTEAGEVKLVPCNNPRAEYKISRMFFIERDGTWPGYAYMDDVFARECSILDISYFYPTAASWDAGDRTISCIRELD